jgi:ABC-type multidrug transport system fused ATPase/permease subunit
VGLTQGSYGVAHVGGWLVLTSMLNVTPAQRIIFLFLVANLYQPVKKLVKAYNNMQDTAASVERTQEFLNLPPRWTRWSSPTSRTRSASRT